MRSYSTDVRDFRVKKAESKVVHFSKVWMWLESLLSDSNLQMASNKMIHILYSEHFTALFSCHQPYGFVIISLEKITGLAGLFWNAELVTYSTSTCCNETEKACYLLLFRFGFLSKTLTWLLKANRANLDIKQREQAIGEIWDCMHFWGFI